MVRIVLKGQEDGLSLRAVASCLAERLGCQISVVKGLESEDGEKPIRVGYASGRYDAVERGRMVTSVAGYRPSRVGRISPQVQREEVSSRLINRFLAAGCPTGEG